MEGIDREPVEGWFEANVEGAKPPLSFDRIAGGRSNLTYGVTDAAGKRWALRRTPLGKALGILAVFVALLPSSLHSPGDFFAAYLPSLVMTAWLAVAAFGLLRDHVAAWVLFGLFAFGGRDALELLAQPASADRAAGGLAILLLALAGVALLAGKRDAEPPRAETSPAPTVLGTEDPG